MTAQRDHRYPPISDYALLSDCFSAALVSRAGSIDWACLRRFDTGSVFGRLLDWDRGGCFALSLRDAQEVTRRYVDESLVLETTVRTDRGCARILDCLVMRHGGRDEPPHRLVRIVEGVEGHVDLDVLIEPRFDYGSIEPWVRRHDRGVFSAVGGDQAIVVSTDADLRLDTRCHRFDAHVTLSGGERVRFALDFQFPHRLAPSRAEPGEMDDGLQQTLRWWRDWHASTVSLGPHARLLRQSAAVLKGLTCAPTGALVAAPTTSLPEQMGGPRNWDYRYSWIRDSSLTVYALTVAGHDEIARGYLDFLMRSTAGNADQLQIMYDCYGGRRLREFEIDGLEGYRGSGPVRVGNAAAAQLQLDTYAHILDPADLWHEDGEFDDDEWRFLIDVVETAADRWQEPDHGLWEVRTEPRHFVHSKAMLWVAVNNGVKLAQRSSRDAPVERWQKVRDEIRDAIDRCGVHPEHDYFVQYFGSRNVDASLLRLPMLGFIEADHPRMRRTVEVIQEQLAAPPHGFLRRYLPDSTRDGLTGKEGLFLTCTYWLIDVLLLQGRRKEAEELFDRLVETGNDVGLFSEEIDPETGELLGNFPQAFTHVGLLVAAHRLAGQGTSSVPAPHE